MNYSVMRPIRSIGAFVILAWPLLLECQISAASKGQAQQPLTVTAVISMVLNSNPRIAAAGERVRAAEGSRRTARSWINPTLSYQVEDTGFPGQATPAGLEKETSATAMIPLAPLYQLRPRSAQANAEVRAAEAELQSVRRSASLDAVGAFYSAALAQVSVSSLDESRAWVDSLITYTAARVREGAAAEVDLIRLELERDRAETDLALARVDVARSRSELASLIGTNQFDIDPARAAESAWRPAPLPPLEDVVARAVTNRPELAAADARIAAAASGVSVQRNAIVRDLGLMTGLKTMSGTRSMIAGLSVTLPLFDQNRGEIQRAVAERRIAAFDRQLSEREIVAEVSATYAAVETLSAQLARMQGGLIRRAEEARRIAEGAYREGATPLTQVLEAARALAEARQLYYRALFTREHQFIALTLVHPSAERAR